MQRVFELISSVGSFVNNVKVTAKKVCRNIILTLTTVIAVLTVVIVSIIINGENKSVVGSITEVAEDATNATEDIQYAENDVIEEVSTEAESSMVAENATEAITNETEDTTVVVTDEPETKKEIYLSNAEAEVKDIVTSTYAPVDIYYTEQDYDALIRIVHAEAGNQDDIGKILVANVIINRVKSDIYPDDIYSVITQRNGDIVQFSPTMDGGSFYTIVPTQHTIDCVNRALAGEDYSEGALYFCRETAPDSWFNTCLTFLFVHGAHYFYK